MGDTRKRCTPRRGNPMGVPMTQKEGRAIAAELVFRPQWNRTIPRQAGICLHHSSSRFSGISGHLHFNNRDRRQHTLIEFESFPSLIHHQQIQSVLFFFIVFNDTSSPRSDERGIKRTISAWNIAAGIKFYICFQFYSRI